MSIRIMTAVWDADLPDSDKIVLLALADCANDEGWCWPGMASLAAKCSKSDRTVQKSIAALCAAGHLTRIERPGHGCRYQVHPRSGFTPEAASPPKRIHPRSDFGAPPKRLRGTPEAASGKPSKNHQEPLEGESAGARKSDDRRHVGVMPTAITGVPSHALPDDWHPELDDETTAMIARCPPGEFDRRLAAFRDHAADTGRKSRNWQAAFRNWLRKSHEGTGQHGTASRKSGGDSGGRRSGGPQPDGFEKAGWEFLRAARRDAGDGGSADADRGESRDGVDARRICGSVGDSGAAAAAAVAMSPGIAGGIVDEHGVIIAAQGR